MQRGFGACDKFLHNSSTTKVRSSSKDFDSLKLHCTWNQKKTRIPSGIWLRLSLWQLSVSSQHNIVPPRSNVREARLNTHGKSLTLNPYMSLLNLKLCSHIWSTNINFRTPPYIGLFGPSWSELSPWVICGGGSIGPATIFFVTDRNVTT